VAGLAAGYPTSSPLLGFFSFALVLVVWFYVHSIQKTQKGKIGIMIAISSDQEDEARQVEWDFIASLRELLLRDAEESGFQLILVPAFAASSINEGGVKVAERYLDKARAHFILYGRARKRMANDKPTHVLNLNLIVRHRRLPEPVKRQFQKDISQALPRKLLLPDDQAVLAFEVVSQLANLGARYTIGLAAFVSGDFRLAEKLLQDIERQLANSDIPHIKQSVPELLKQLYGAWLNIASNTWFLARDDGYVNLTDEIATKLLERDGMSYHALISKAIANFVLRRDIQGAVDLLKKCQNSTDPTWRYNLAFLYAYEGQLEEANEQYRQAFKGELMNPDIPLHCEDFMQRILDKEPDKKQLHFCLGSLNYNMKRDYSAAIEDFSKFVDWSGSEKFPHLRETSVDLQRRSRERLAQENS
jgi:tetratricopeptide (TPR) repeat protein